MPHILSITDYDLMTIGDDVRLNEGTQIQGHSFEQRILKLAPVSIGNSCVLMSGSIVMAGCKLMGNNRLYPGTLIMKNDQLPSNTHWKGVPALLANVALTDQNVLEINCGRGVGAAWCVHTHASPSYIGIDPSQDVINLCERLYSTTPQLSFVVADATKHLPFENESIDIVLCIEATHAFGQPLSITQFANEVARVLRPNGYLLWCDFCYMNGSGTSIYDLIANDELIIEEKINITKNVLHALDIQNKSRTDFIQRYIQPAPASFAQARIWLDERIRFGPDNPQIAIYNMPFIYHLQSDHTLSIKQLRHALYLTVNKHLSLHTSLYFDIQKNLLMQRVITHENKNNNNNMFSIIETIYETDEQLNELLHGEKHNPHLFDLPQGLVFRCHIIYYKQISSNHLLSHKDLLIFNFHHALFDFPSMNIFLHDLNQAYTTGQLLYDDNTNLRYLDYAVIEKQMLMTGASMFWLDVLHDCKLDQPLSLPFDRYRLANEHRTGRGTSISFDFGQDPSHDFLTHASLNNVSLEHLTFAIYFIFLLKQTNGQTDLCTAININNNRYRDELKSIIGLFENVIPLRCQLDPNWSFHQLLEHVQEIIINSMKYSYFPLQRILNQHPHISKHSFLDTSLEFISSKSNNDNNAMMIGDSQLVPKSFSFNINGDEILSVSDFSLSIYHDINMNQLSCTINASLDLFNRETVEKISQRFHFILHELSASINDNRMSKPIYELSLVLPNEQYLMQSLNNTQVSFPSPVTCIHHEFVYQVMKHPQKLAVELDEQSLTYAELFAYVQMLAVHLLDEYGIIPSEVISQCVERSLSMVIGIMTIEMAGGVYFPLSFRDPQNRLHTLLQQTQSRLVLSHYLTKNKFNDLTTILDIDSILVNNNLFQHIDIDQLSSVHVTIDSIAYIIFTSGSTGVPKGVSIEFAIQLTYNKGNK
ncbi:unnamed protein product [Adineta steineri]|uniref:Methyltransferase type 11 domain-containing protein n=1 Tax=Adineta steineri TaxID=433720 RepID=A0A814FNX0_9BILA|nr:unnamed protein product [Adineta steineri]